MKQLEFNLISQYSQKDLKRIDQVIKLNPKYQRGIDDLVENVLKVLLSEPLEHDDYAYYLVSMPLDTAKLIDDSYKITHGHLDLRQNYQTEYIANVNMLICLNIQSQK